MCTHLAVTAVAFPYWVLASTLIVGQAIAGVCGMLLVTALERSDLRSYVWAKK
jgi:hypothetical protein